MTEMLPLALAALLLIVIGGGTLLALAIHQLREDLDTATDDISSAHERIDRLGQYVDGLRDFLAAVFSDEQPPAVAGPATAPAGAVIDAQHRALIERELDGRTFSFRAPDVDPEHTP